MLEITKTAVLRSSIPSSRGMLFSRVQGIRITTMNINAIKLLHVCNVYAILKIHQQRRTK